ncbi:unnamed protein product, partial [Dicrocoelium dendriticum]
NEACQSNVIMCPACDERHGCRFYHLRDMCFYIRASYLFDHPGTVFYSIFMVIWAVTFLEFWKRKNARLAYRWDVMDYETVEERPRPQYAAMCSELAENPVTGALEPHFPERRRKTRIVAGLVLVLLMQYKSSIQVNNPKFPSINMNDTPGHMYLENSPTFMMKRTRRK